MVSPHNRNRRGERVKDGDGQCHEACVPRTRARMQGSQQLRLQDDSVPEKLRKRREMIQWQAGRCQVQG